MKVKGQKLKICAKKARAANKRRVAFFPKIATRWIYFIHIFRQLLVPNLSKSEKKSSVLALVPYYTDYWTLEAFESYLNREMSTSTCELDMQALNADFVSGYQLLLKLCGF